MRFRAIYKKKVINIGREPYLEENTPEPTITEMFAENDSYWDELLQMELSEREYLLYNAIRKIKNETCQKVMFFRYIDELKSAEIAERLQITRGGVDNLIYEGKKALKEIFTKNSIF